MKRKISFIILNYNDAESVKKICSTIYSYTSIDHIVIVDNMSPDNSFEQLACLANKKIDVIQTNRNGGYSYGNNYGAYYLIDTYHVELLFIANPDVEFTEEFIIRIVNDMINHKAQAATGFMLMPSVPRLIMNKKINSYWQELLDCTLLLHRFFSFSIIPVEKGKGVFSVEWLPGSLFAIDADVYKKIKGLDDRVFLYYEEQMLGEKFKNTGYKMIIDSNIEYLHNHSVSIDKSLKRIAQLKKCYESKYFFFTTYKNIGYFRRILMKIMMYYGIAARRIFYPLMNLIKS